MKAGLLGENPKPRCVFWELIIGVVFHLIEFRLRSVESTNMAVTLV